LQRPEQSRTRKIFAQFAQMKKKILSLQCISLLVCLASSQLVFSSRPTTRQLTLQIHPQFNTEPLLLSSKQYVSAQGDTLRIDRFRFYLSSIQLLMADGTVFKEKESYHLIDAEDEGSLQVKLSDVPRGKIREIQFGIGVDSIKSVSGVFGGDLDPSNGMYWAWNSGYIHAKLEGSSPSCKTHQHAFEFHIGGFSYPNNAIKTVTIAINQDADKIILAADAYCWLKNIDLAVTNSVVMPGEESLVIADNYSTMFKLLSE
jgi:hypothetical protein